MPGAGADRSAAPFAGFFDGRGVYGADELSELRELEMAFRAGRDRENSLAQALSIVIEGAREPQVLRNTKSFRRPPFSSAAHQRRGLHLFRVIFSRHALDARPAGEHAETFAGGGLVVLPGFVGDPGRVAGIARLTARVAGAAVRKRGNLVSQFKGADADLVAEAVDRIETAALSAIRRPGDAAARKIFRDGAYAQRIDNRPDDKDEQKVPHSDIFFPALKWWWFPHGIGRGRGAFRYAVGSPELTPAMLEFRHRHAIEITSGAVDAWRGKGHADGSLRASGTELNMMGLTCAEQPVAADTLLIANVFGIHARGQVTMPSERLSLHGSLRVGDPFA